MDLRPARSSLLIAIGLYLAFTKQLPFTSAGYELHATFENAATLRPTSPVRIAGVNVGKVTSVERDGDAAEVTFTVDDEGQPIHDDAEVKIRPRLFLEGNFFLDLEPGQPERARARRRRHDPVTQTATAVQLDEVLTALQAPTRKGLQQALAGFGTALNYEPTAAATSPRTPTSRARPRPRRSTRRSTTAGRPGRDTAIVNEALLGESPHDLSGLIAANRQVFGEARRAARPQLKDLITNFNTFTGALAAESTNLSRRRSRELAPTLEQAQPVARRPQRRAAAAPRAGDRAHARASRSCRRRSRPPTRGSTRPTSCLGRAELGGLAALLQSADAGRSPRSTRGLEGAVHRSRRRSQPLRHRRTWSRPATSIDQRRDYPFGRTRLPAANFHEFFYGARQPSRAPARASTATAPTCASSPGGGAVLGQHAEPARRLPQHHGEFGNNDRAPARHPADAHRPRRRRSGPTSPAHTNPLPDLNGAGGAGLPGDVGRRPDGGADETGDPRTPARLHRDRGAARRRARW